MGIYLLTVLCPFIKTGRRAPSYRNPKRKEFRRNIASRLFKVIGRLMGMLMTLWDTGGEGKRADHDILTVVFLGRGLGTVNAMPLTSI